MFNVSSLAYGKDPLFTRVLGLGAAALMRNWIRTLDMRIAHYDITADPLRPEFRGRVIMAFWHEYIMAPFALWGRSNSAILTSQHRDAGPLTCAGKYLGYRVVRGSSTRGGAAALRELQRIAQRHNVGMTPDGPQGPRREMAMGPIYLASKLGLPIVPLGFGFDRPWRMKTWDRFALPRPFGRARIVWGPRLTIPPRLRRNGLEECRRYVEEVLQRVTAEAEDWATTGTRRVGEREVSCRR